LHGQQGVENRGFVQPAQMIDVLREHGAFVLASNYDPWPLVIVEAAAAGLPVVCTEACGSAVEVVRTNYSGVLSATGDAPALADALRWMHDRHQQLPTVGARGRELAAAYSAQMWAARWSEAARQDLAGCA
jgi:glycosyltransferase involved in cell wall biosynthesis